MHKPAQDASAESATDPVCGMRVDPATAKDSWQYQGRKYYFCCDGCLEMFRADPGRFLAKAAAPAPLPAKPAAGRYTCPMDPEIEQDGPGSCPKCGMALVPVLPAVKGAVEYTCPMHPEVRSPSPGSCPKCGMALVPIAGTGAAGNPELRDLTRSEERRVGKECRL